MAAPWNNSALFSLPACLPCCTSVAPTTCACALQLPLAFDGTATYASITDAQNALLYNAYDCLGAGFTSGYGPGVANPIDIDINIATPGTTLVTCQSTATAGEFIIAYINGSFKAGTLTFAFTNNSFAPQSIVELLDCETRDVLDDDSSNAASGTMTLDVPADGTYLIRFRSADMTISGTVATYSMTSSAAYVLNPVIAYWDDSGTTRQLFACPKLILPYDDQDASPTHWFPSLTDAQFTLLHNVSTGCLGYTVSRPNTFTVGFSGGTLSVVGNTPNASPPSAPNSYFECLVSVNAVAGQTLSVAYVVSGPMFSTLIFVDATIFDDSRNTVEYLSSASPMVSSPLPYTGKYVIRLRCQFDDSPISTAWTITSSGTMTANTMELWYDTGLDCPARLECDDSHTYMPDYDGGGGEA